MKYRVHFDVPVHGGLRAGSRPFDTLASAMLAVERLLPRLGFLWDTRAGFAVAVARNMSGDVLARVVSATTIDRHSTLGELDMFLRQHAATDLRVTHHVVPTDDGLLAAAHGGGHVAYGSTAIDAVIALCAKLGGGG